MALTPEEIERYKRHLVLREVGGQGQQKIKAALLKLKPNDPQSEKILGAARLTGFAPVADKDYDELRKAAKVAGAL